MNGYRNADESPRWALLLLIIGIVVLAAFGLRTITNSDFWMHLATGRWIAGNGIPRFDNLSFTMAGRPWIDPTWLYDRMLVTLWRVGQAPLVTMFHTALLVGAFLVLIPTARKWAGLSSIGAAFLLSAWLIAPRFVVGPELIGLFFAALFVFVLSQKRPLWALAALVPVQLLWTNMHGSFLLGPALCALFTVDAVMVEKSSTPDRKVYVNAPVYLVGLTAAALIACLVNPYALRLPLFVIASWTDVANNFVQEWISPFSAQFPQAFYVKHVVTLALVVGAGGFIAERRRLPIGITALAVFTAFLAVRSLKHLPLFAVLSFPFFALSLSAVGGLVADRLGAAARIAATAFVGLAGLLGLGSLAAVTNGAYHVGTGSAARFGLGADYALFPQAAAQVIERPDFPQKAVNLPWDGGYLVWTAPERTVFTDSRASLYGPEFYRMLTQALAGNQEVLEGIEQKWDPGAFIVSCVSPGGTLIARNLLMTGRWSLVYFDGVTAILVRGTSDNLELINDAEVQESGLRVLEQERKAFLQRVKSTGKRAVSPRLVGAADFFMALGRYNDARSVYELLTIGTPNMAGAWSGLGFCDLQLGNNESAVRALRRATELMPRNAMTWLYYSRACEKTGQGDEARRAFNKGRDLNTQAAMNFQNESNAERDAERARREADAATPAAGEP